jgi:hypothetical protein
VLLPLYQLHWFEFFLEIRGSESKELITLRFLEPRRFCGFVVPWWLFLGASN